MISSDDQVNGGRQMDVPGMDMTGPDGEVSVGNGEALAAAERQRHVLQELEDKYAYLSADFATFRRRTAQELRSASIQAQAKILRDVLIIYDDVMRAHEILQQQVAVLPEGVGAAALEGISLVQKNCEKMLEQHGATKITQLRTFDPTLHEALLQVVATSDFPAGSIVQVFEPGYMHGGVLLRPARVSVAHDA